MSTKVLVIAAIDGAENCARVISEQVGMTVEVATTRKAGLLALRQESYSVMVVDQSLIESDPVWADLVWQHAGLAMPVQINFAISSSMRLAREVKAALTRREGELASARKTAAREIENDLRSSVTGLLLESELALREPSMPPELQPKMRHLVELAGILRERLRCGAQEALTT